MLLALEFYVRTINPRVNLPVPSSFCVQSGDGDRKVVTLHAAYKRPDVVAVRHWHLSDCTRHCSLPGLKEKLVARDKVLDDDFVVIPDHRILKFKSQPLPQDRNTIRGPMPVDLHNEIYDRILSTESHQLVKCLWVWREFVKIYFSSEPKAPTS